MSDSIYRRAIERFGHVAQWDMVYEECGELITAISRRERGRCGDEEVASEVADVLIMCEQAALMLPEGMVAEAKRAKLERLEARMGGDDDATR